MTRQAPWPGRFVWHDLMTKDAGKAQAFYAGLFGWQIQEVPMQGFTYRMIFCGPGPIGGIVEEQNIPHAHWMGYVAVEDVDAAAQKCRELGGSVCVPPTDIPATGRFAVCGDPTGAYFTVYRGQDESPGFDPDLPVPGRVCWNELWTKDAPAALRFYREMFGWRSEDMPMQPMGTYHVQKLRDKDAAGIMVNPEPGAPPCWAQYFLVEDLDASTRKAEQLGGSKCVGPIDVPNIGTFNLVTDPTGAMFALFRPAAGR
jgi:predicted enzyme related to lactoylglutathione lyase